MRENMHITVSELLENGCRKDIVDKVYQLSLDHNKTDLMLILTKYRQELKNKIDADGKLIDCIDYLIYNLEKQ